MRESCLTEKDEPRRKINQLVVPQFLVSVIVQRIHNSSQAGYTGRDHCLRQTKLLYYFPLMRKDIYSHISISQSCAENTPVPSTEASILPYPSPRRPWDALVVNIS